MLALAKDFGCPFLNVIGQLMPRTRPADDRASPRRWIDLADSSDCPLVFETHRHGLLNDLFPTLAMLEAVDDLALCADLSHFVVDREFPAELDPESQRMIAQVLDRSVAFQGRISSNEQIQLPIGFPQHQVWVERFFGWWSEGLRAWRGQGAGGRHGDLPVRTWTAALRHNRRGWTRTLRPLARGARDP